MLRWVVVLWSLAGCDVLLRLDHVDPRGDALADGADRPADAPSEIPGDGLPACPASYMVSVSGSTSRYRQGGLDAPWTTAETLCEMDGVGVARRTHLAVIEDETERTRLFSTLAANGLSKSSWIGLSDRKTEGTMKWVTAEPIGVPQNGLDPPWAAGQPDNNSMQPGGQDCVRMIAPGTNEEGHFDDVECIANFDFVCECDDYPPVAANF